MAKLKVVFKKEVAIDQFVLWTDAVSEMMNNHADGKHCMENCHAGIRIMYDKRIICVCGACNGMVLDIIGKINDSIAKDQNDVNYYTVVLD